MERDNKKPTADPGDSPDGVPDDSSGPETAHGPWIDLGPPTADDIRRANELVYEHGWFHLVDI
jgi:hypothetical protein